MGRVTRSQSTVRLKILLVAVSLTICVAGLGYRAVTANTGPPKPATAGNPEAVMSDAQRETLHQKQWNDFDQRYGAWLNGLDQRKLDLRSLPRYPLNASIVPGQPTLHDAVATADLVVVGTVLSIAPTKYSGTATVVSVDQTVKGPVAPAVAVTQAGGLRPTQDWTGVTIAEGENGGLLLPGDRAVLLLQKHSTGYEIQSVSGWYVVVNGLVRANRLNAWGRSVDGETETAFIQQLQAAAQ